MTKNTMSKKKIKAVKVANEEILKRVVELLKKEEIENPSAFDRWTCPEDIE